MRYLVTYDVNRPHHEAVKAQCLENGFQDYIKTSDGNHMDLPNTTLTVIADNAEDAVNKFKYQVSLVRPSGFMHHDIIIEKVIRVECTEFYPESDNSRRIAKAKALADVLMQPRG
jgi:hypothetical protein